MGSLQVESRQVFDSDTFFRLLESFEYLLGTASFDIFAQGPVFAETHADRLIAMDNIAYELRKWIAGDFPRRWLSINVTIELGLMRAYKYAMQTYRSTDPPESELANQNERFRLYTERFKTVRRELVEAIEEHIRTDEEIWEAMMRETEAIRLNAGSGGGSGSGRSTPTRMDDVE